MIKANKFESQVIHYCKLWFELPNTIEEISQGLKIIMAEHYASKPEWYCDEDVYKRLLKIAFKFTPQGLLIERLNKLFWHENNITMQDFIKELFGEIQILQIKSNNETLIELVDPDFSVLPRRRKDV